MHVERLENSLFDIIVERHARGALHDISCKRGPPIRISRCSARIENPVGYPTLEIGTQRQDRIGIKCDQILDRLFETSRVRHKLTHRDWLAVAGRDFEIEIFVDVRVEVDLALLNLLHHGRPGDQFRDRSWTEKRRCRVDRSSFSHIGIAIALGRDDLSVLHHRHHRAREIA